jgi:hypothetical protein
MKKRLLTEAEMYLARPERFHLHLKHLRPGENWEVEKRDEYQVPVYKLRNGVSVFGALLVDVNEED